MKLLIFIVAYNAEKHISKVLQRIPKTILDTYDYEILIIDDSSKDKTFDVAKNFQSTHSDINLKVLYNPINQGYGGNQKLGYHYAIKNGFDAVVLLHGDGQYAPEIMQDMVSPIEKGEAELVMGSRMIIKGGALKGGMPLYKFVGNKVLTTIQNKILKTNLTEFHSGYRAFSVKALADIPFERNTNGFDFDTLIIIQFILKQFNIKEIPIPTHYGDEICHVNGFEYAWQVSIFSLKSRLHKMGIFYQRSFDVHNEPKYDLKMGYTSSHTLAINHIKPESKVLDIGCGNGSVLKALQEKSCKISGIDLLPEEQLITTLDKYHLCNLDELNLPKDAFEVDYILFLDVLEKLKEPEKFMDHLRERCQLNQPSVIITTPNIGFFISRLQLLLGNFNYNKRGILDFTHRRLFTFNSLKKLCKQSGYIIKKSKGIPAPFPKAIKNNFFSRLLLGINKLLINISKRLFAYQIYIEVSPTPVVTHLMEHSIDKSAKRKVEKVAETS